MMCLRKHVITIISLVFLGSCQVDTFQGPKNSGKTLSIDVSANIPQTKTTMSDDKTACYFSFATGNKIGFFAENILLNTELQCTSASAGSFEGRLTIETDGQKQYRPSVSYYSYYPYQSGATDASSVNAVLPSVQSAPFDGNADFLVANPVTDIYDVNNFPSLSFTFATHLLAIVKLCIINTSDALEKEELLDIGLSSFGPALAGSFTFDATDPGKAVEFSTNPKSISHSVKVCNNTSRYPLLGKGVIHTVYAVVNPAEYEAGDLQLVVHTKNHTFLYSTTSSVNLSREYVSVFPTVDISSNAVTRISKEMLTFSLSDGSHNYDAFEISDGVISVQVPNALDLSSMTVSFTYKGASVTVDGTPQSSGEQAHDFSDFTKPLKYVVTSEDGTSRSYIIRIFNLPVVTVETPDRVPIVDRENWIPSDKTDPQQTEITIRQTAEDGAISVETYSAQIKGRGNSSWRSSNKKPYSIKLNKSKAVLDMPEHKRWALLNNCWGCFFGNRIGYELGRRAESIPWSPSGRYVELILNGEYRGCYLIVEAIKVDSNRLDITEMSTEDKDGDAVTGGYLLNYDSTMDEPNQFYSSKYNMPVMIRYPDDDDLTTEQFNYIQDYINKGLEASLANNALFAVHDYVNYLDINSLIDVYFIWELAGKTENWDGSDFNRPGSVWYYKDRGDVLRAGPVWDFDSYLFYSQSILCNTGQYYGRLFQSPYFIHTLKERWPKFRQCVEADVKTGDSILDFLDQLYDTVRPAALRDRVMWPWGTTDAGRKTLKQQYDIIRTGLPAKLDYMEAYFNSLEVTYDNKGTSTENYGAQDNQGGNFNFGF